jgi:hypothetical protein
MDRAPQLTTADAALLLACARTRIDRLAQSRIATLLRGPVRWPALVGAAKFHGVLPLVHAALGTVDPGLVPAAARERIRADVRASVHHALFLTADLFRLMALFEAAGVTGIPFKGPVLAAMAYGDVTLREFSDLDIFVRKSELAAIARLLLAGGYRSETHDGDVATARYIAADGDVAFRGPGYHTFYRADGRCRVDLQWRMAERFFAFSLEGDEPGWDFVSMPIAGRSVRTFAPADMLLILCVHGSKHHWEKLKWICDVAECIRAHGDAIDWRALYDKASRLRAARMLGLGLRLAEGLLDATLPAEISRQLESDRALTPLVHERRAALVAGATAPRSSLPRMTFYLRTKDGWHDRLGFCAAYVRQFATLLVKPTERDARWVGLPRPLEPLYYVLRPIRLLATYARSARRPHRSPSTVGSASRAPGMPPPVAAEPTRHEGAKKC